MFVSRCIQLHTYTTQPIHRWNLPNGYFPSDLTDWVDAKAALILEGDHLIKHSLWVRIQHHYCYDYVKKWWKTILILVGPLGIFDFVARFFFKKRLCQALARIVCLNNQLRWQQFSVLLSVTTPRLDLSIHQSDYTMSKCVPLKWLPLSAVSKAGFSGHILLRG